MNKSQKYILLLTGFMLGLLFLFPPAHRFNTFSEKDQSFGHQPCWTLGDFLQRDYSIMGVEALGIVLVGSILCLANKSKV